MQVFHRGINFYAKSWENRLLMASPKATTPRYFNGCKPENTFFCFTLSRGHEPRSVLYRRSGHGRAIYLATTLGERVREANQLRGGEGPSRHGRNFTSRSSIWFCDRLFRGWAVGCLVIQGERGGFYTYRICLKYTSATSFPNLVAISSPVFVKTITDSESSGNL